MNRKLPAGILAALLLALFFARPSTDSAHLSSAAPDTPTHPAAPQADLETAPTLSAPEPVAQTGGTDTSNPARPLFAYIERPAGADVWEAQQDRPARDIHYVQIDRAVALDKKSPFWRTGGGGRVTFPLPGGRTLTAVVRHTQSLGPDRFSSAAGIEGQPLGSAAFAYNEGEMSAVIDHPVYGTWELRAEGDGVAQLYQVDPAIIPPCRVTRLSAEKVAYLRRRAEAARAMAAPAESTPGDPVTAAAAPSSFPEVRILFVYTQAALNTARSSAILTSRMDLAVQILNDSLARSEINGVARIAGMVAVTYNERASADKEIQDDALDRLADASDGYMDEIHAERDRTAADLVCLVHQGADDPPSVGLAYLPDRPGAPWNQDFGFSAVDVEYLARGHVFAHEIGHNLGCAHDRDNAKPGTSGGGGNLPAPSSEPQPGVFPYSFGYKFQGADGKTYGTIMSYERNRLGYFSNPDITAPSPVSVKLGVPGGQPGEADNARTIREEILEIASYRSSNQMPYNAGTLFNVSTRAYASGGMQQLIGGFIVTGTSPKRMLIRAIGPDLVGRGVGDAMPDPKLTLYRLANGGATRLATNLNWGDNGPNFAAEMSALVPRPLPAGSRDAAMVQTLEPGAYSANVESEDGRAGTALVEAFEYDHVSSRFFNLSTRGWADRAHPMVGGFIVHEDPAHPGRTKRLVIRAVGPSMAQPPANVTGAMEDPYITVWDASGRQILACDDWTQATNGSDNRPVAKGYTQAQLAAINLAPLNRREPAVMVDLPPGGFTVMVTPFEELPDNPEKPGIALIEVFEVNP